jgi:hypothetical protein
MRIGPDYATSMVVTTGPGGRYDFSTRIPSLPAIGRHRLLDSRVHEFSLLQRIHCNYVHIGHHSESLLNCRRQSDRELASRMPA